MVLAARLEEDREPMGSLNDARWAREMVQGAFASHAAGGKKLALPLEQREHPLKSWS